MGSLTTRKHGDDSLVHITRNKVLTTSLAVADKFGKRHDRVIRAIRNLECSDDFRLLNFGESSYENQQGKKQPMYEMTRDGFSYLVMGFTGKKAAEWKEKYIAAFNAMEEAIARQSNDQWINDRGYGKGIRRELTDTIGDFVEYATVQGSKSAKKYFANISKMNNKALFLVGKASPQPFRDLLDSMQLAFLVTAEIICKQALQDGMSEGLHYKEIYKLAKERVEEYAAILPPTKLLV